MDFVLDGSKLWLLNYIHPTKKRLTNLSLGKYPDLSFAIARKLSQKARELIIQGIAPQEDKKRKQQEHKIIHQYTLLNIAKEWFEIKQGGITPNYAVDIWRSLKLHIFPSLSNTPIRDITAQFKTVMDNS